MCIIVDANSVHHIINNTADGAPILRWLFDRKKRTGLIIGGRLSSELRRAGFGDVRNAEFLKTLKILSDAGRIHRFEDGLVEKTAEQIKDKCQSNDPHVVALAIVARCGAVFTNDGDLMKDLKDRRIVGHRISIYKNTAHCHLLRECKCNVTN